MTEALRAHPLFKSLTSAQTHTLLAASHIQNVEKDQLLFLQDEESKCLYLVLSGYIKLFRETAHGAEAILNIAGPGTLFCETALFSHKKHPFSAQVAQPAEIMTIPYAVIEPLILTDPAFARAMLESMTAARHAQDKEIEHRTLQSTAQRIGCFILRLGRPMATGPQTIQLPYDKTLIAARLGMQPETFSRGLNRLRDDMGLGVQGSVITIPDTQNLHRYCCTGCSSNFPCTDMR